MKQNAGAVTDSAAETSFENAARREISRRVVALLKDFVGRGPTTARTFFNEHLVLVVLEDTLTKGERTLAEDDRVGLVRELRRGFLAAMGSAITEIVEEETGRKVHTFLGDYAVLPDYAIKAFVLEPDPTDPAGAGDEKEGGLAPDEDGGPRLSLEARDDEPLREQQATISRQVVTMLKELAGRGPTLARTYIDDDVVTVLLADTLTTAERTLAREDPDQTGRVREIRRELQEVIEGRAVSIVESCTERSVKAFLSDHSVLPDYAIEVFLLDSKLDD